HVVRCERKADRLRNPLGLPSNGFEALIDWRVKILFAAVGTDPHGDLIDIDGLAMKLKPDAFSLVFHGAITKLTRVVRRHNVSSSCTYAVMIKSTLEVRNRHTTEAERPSIVV